ncbi:MAG TPA: hypothetical protein VIV11_02350 [Kofleriaceae bacterium]
MRSYPRADRQQFRLGNVLPDVSGEIAPQRLAEGTGTHEIADADEIQTARYGALRPRDR